MTEKEVHSITVRFKNGTRQEFQPIDIANHMKLLALAKALRE